MRPLILTEEFVPALEGFLEASLKWHEDNLDTAPEGTFAEGFLAGLKEGVDLALSTAEELAVDEIEESEE